MSAAKRWAIRSVAGLTALVAALVLAPSPASATITRVYGHVTDGSWKTVFSDVSDPVTGVVTVTTLSDLGGLTSGGTWVNIRTTRVGSGVSGTERLTCYTHNAECSYVAVKIPPNVWFEVRIQKGFPGGGDHDFGGLIDY